MLDSEHHLHPEIEKGGLSLKKVAVLFFSLIENNDNKHKKRFKNKMVGRKLALQKGNRDLSSSNSQDVMIQINSALHTEKKRVYVWFKHVQ